MSSPFEVAVTEACAALACRRPWPDENIGVRLDAARVATTAILEAQESTLSELMAVLAEAMRFAREGQGMQPDEVTTFAWRLVDILDGKGS